MSIHMPGWSACCYFHSGRSSVARLRAHLQPLTRLDLWHEGQLLSSGRCRVAQSLLYLSFSLSFIHHLESTASSRACSCVHQGTAGLQSPPCHSWVSSPQFSYTKLYDFGCVAQYRKAGSKVLEYIIYVSGGPRCSQEWQAWALPWVLEISKDWEGF